MLQGADDDNNVDQTFNTTDSASCNTLRTFFSDLDQNRLTVVNIDLHEDLRMGRILGYGGIFISSIYTFIEDHGHDAFYNRQFSPKEDDEPPIVLVSLNGRFQLQDDPSPSVVKWLHSQKRGRTWRRQQRQRKKGEEFLLRVAAHIRVPESYCSAKWKKANDMSHVMDTLKVLKEQWDRVINSSKQRWRHR